jgi:hypothetical protein
MSRRFYVEASELPRVIDSRDGFAVFTADPGERHTADRVARAMNRIWERDVDFVVDWITSYGPYDDDGHMAWSWRREMES